MTGFGKIILTESVTDWSFTVFFYKFINNNKHNVFDIHFFADTQNCGRNNVPQRISNGLADQIWPWMASIGFYFGE